MLSALRASTYEPSRREVCISITDPNAESVRLSEKFADVLRVSFSDILEPTDLPSHRLFTAAEASAILQFVRRWQDVDRIVVHCGAGLSRSPAVALAIADLHGLPTAELERQFPLWNRFVRQLLARVAAGTTNR